MQAPLHPLSNPQIPSGFIQTRECFKQKSEKSHLAAAAPHGVERQQSSQQVDRHLASGTKAPNEGGGAACGVVWFVVFVELHV